MPTIEGKSSSASIYTNIHVPSIYQPLKLKNTKHDKVKVIEKFLFRFVPFHFNSIEFVCSVLLSRYIVVSKGARSLFHTHTMCLLHVLNEPISNCRADPLPFGVLLMVSALLFMRIAFFRREFNFCAKF